MHFSLFIHRKGDEDVSKIATKVQKVSKVTHWASVEMDQSPADETTASWNDNISAMSEEIIGVSINDECSFSGAVSKLHSLADQLPAVGVIFDVFLWPPKPDNINNSDYITFLGSLKRLKEWHNANFYIFDAEPNLDSEFLQRFLSASFHISAEDFTYNNVGLLWRGKVSICDKIENKGVVVPGLSLHNTDRSKTLLTYPVQDPSLLNANLVDDGALLGRMIEILDEVDLSSIPTFLRTPAVFKLCLYQKHAFSQVLLSYIQQNAQTGMLARLCVYPNIDTLPICSDVGLSTIAWKENIMADIQFVQEPEEELQDNYEFLYFVITAPSKDSSAGSFVASVNLLKHPYNMNSSLATVLYHNALLSRDKGEHSKEVQSEIDNLPWLTPDLMKEIENDLMLVQQVVLKGLLSERLAAGQSSVVPVGQVKLFLQEARLKYFNSLAQTLPKFGQFRPLKEQTSEVSTDQKEAYTATVSNGYEWPERLIQQYHECQKRSLSRLQSCENMLLSSPLQPAEVPPTVDIQNLLKCFLPDGSAACDSLSPVRRRHTSRTCRSFSENNPKELGWPESKTINCHDVYYNNDKKSEKMNNHLNKLRDKYVKEETFSSCLAVNVLFPRGDKTKAKGNHSNTDRILKSENPELRRSPRKRTARSVFDENVSTSFDSKREKRGSLGARFSDSMTPLSTIHERPSSKRFSTPQPVPSRERRRMSSLTTKESRRLSDATMVSGNLDFSGSRKGRRESLNTSITSRRDSLDSSRRDSLDVSRRDSLDSSRRESLNSSRRDSLDSVCSQGGRKESRSERHKRKLLEIVENVLIENGLMRTDPIFSSCSTRLFKVTKLFVMDLPTSRNLKAEMKKIASSQVQQVIEVDRARQKTNTD